MTWIVTQSSTMLGTLAPERAASHFRVIQREAGVLIVAANAVTVMFENSEPTLSLRILDLCEQTLDAHGRSEGVLEAIAVALRELISRLGGGRGRLVERAVAERGSARAVVERAR